MAATSRTTGTDSPWGISGPTSEASDAPAATSTAVSSSAAATGSRSSNAYSAFAPSAPGASAAQTNEDRLRELALRDDLTGLYNRRYLFAYLNKVLASADVQRFCLVFADIDRFKEINDTHGHLAGDELLRGLAYRLKASVGGEPFVVRYAGDEFCLLLPGSTIETATQIAEQARQRICRTPVSLGEGRDPVAVTMSFGVATAGRDGRNAQELIDSADRALYSAKRAGRNRVAVPSDAPKSPGDVQTLLAGFPCPKVVGRTTELARLESLSHFGERGPTGLVFIEGPGGGGKSRLISELGLRRARAGHVILHVSGRQELRTSPYGALLAMFRRLFDDHEPLRASVEQSLPERECEALAYCVPELLPTISVPEPEDQSAWRAQLFAAILGALRHLGKRHNGLLAVDDAQYLDGASLRVILFLVRHERQTSAGAGLVVFATVATDTLQAMEDEEGAFSHFRRLVDNRVNVATLQLKSLERDHVQEMVDACFDGHDFPAGLSGKVYQVTRGNPLFIEEVLIILTLSGFLVPEGSRWRLEQRSQVSVPDSMGEIIRKHLGTLDDEAADAVRKAAVIGTNFSVDLLQRVLNLNQGRVLALTDQARSHRLLQSDDASGSEELSFRNRKLRELTYEIVSDDVREHIHRQVAAVQESQPTAGLDEALALIAWHYEKSGDKERASRARTRQMQHAKRLYRQNEEGKYFEIAGKIAAPRAETDISEANLPLPDEALALVPEVMKDLVSVRRGVQMYPPGSDYTQTAAQRCVETCRAVLQHAESFTLKERDGGVEVNSVPLPARFGGGVAELLVALFMRAGIGSVTFNRATDLTGVLAIAEGMSSAAQGEPVAWPEWFKSRGIVGIGVVPKRYKASADADELLSLGESVEGLAKESARHLPVLRAILRYAAGMVEAIQIFPKGSETRTRAVEGFCEALVRAHQEISLIALGQTKDAFLVNDLRVDPRAIGESLQVMRVLLQRLKIRSIAFSRGINAQETERLFEYLLNERTREQGAPSEVELVAIGVIHIRVDEVVFVADDAQGGGQGGSAESEIVRIDHRTFLRRVLEGQPAELLESHVRTELPGLVGELLLNGNRDDSERIIAKLFGNFEAPEAHLRVSALGVMQEMVAGCSRGVARDLYRLAAPHMALLLRDERTPVALHKLIDLSARACDELLRGDDSRAAARLLWNFGRSLEADEHADMQVRQAAGEAVERIMASPAFADALKKLWSPIEHSRAVALHLLEGCGSKAHERLLQLVCGAQTFDDAHTFASQLATVAKADQIEEALVRLVTPFAPAQQVRNLLHVAPVLVIDTYPLLLRALSHPDPATCDAAIQMVRGLPRSARDSVVLNMLRGPEAAVRAAGVDLAAEYRLGPALDSLIELAQQDSEAAPTRRAACMALGRLSDRRATDTLMAMIDTSWWRRFRRKSAPPHLRVAAVWALAQHDTTEARAALARAVDDDDAQVAHAAATVLGTPR